MLVRSRGANICKAPANYPTYQKNATHLFIIIIMIIIIPLISFSGVAEFSVRLQYEQGEASASAIRGFNFPTKNALTRLGEEDRGWGLFQPAWFAAVMGDGSLRPSENHAL